MPEIMALATGIARSRDEYCVSIPLDNVGTLLAAEGAGSFVQWYLAHNPGMELIEVALTFHDEDHAGLLADGSGSMGGNLNMGAFEITNVGNVDGVDVSAHQARHRPGGADPLPTAAPGQGIGDDNLEGTSTSFARADHRHKLRTTSGPTDLTIGSIAAGQPVVRSGTELVGATTVAATAHAASHQNGGADEVNVEGLTGQEIAWDAIFTTAALAQTTFNLTSNGTSTIALGLAAPKACTIKSVTVVALHDDTTSPPAAWTLRLRENGSGSDSATFTFSWNATNGVATITAGAWSSNVAIATTDYFGLVADGSSIDGPKIRVRVQAVLD